MRRRNKKAKLVALLFLFMLIGIGYASLNANLKLAGTANISNAKWDVHFNNAQLEYASAGVTFNSNSNSNVALGTPRIKGTHNDEIEYDVTFNAPGEYYEFTVDVVNGGDMDAQYFHEGCSLKVKIGNGEEIELEDCLNDVNWPSYLTYYYEEYDHNTDYRYLPAGDTVKMLVHLGLNADISNEEWEAIRGKEIKISDSINFKQGFGNPNP